MPKETQEVKACKRAIAKTQNLIERKKVQAQAAQQKAKDIRDEIRAEREGLKGLRQDLRDAKAQAREEAKADKPARKKRTGKKKSVKIKKNR